MAQVALLHLWTLVKNASGYNACVGTVFNCPGAYDGTRGYTTSDVVEIQVRSMCVCLECTRGKARAWCVRGMPCAHRCPTLINLQGHRYPTLPT